MSIDISTGISIYISIDVGPCVGRYLVDMSVDTSSVYQSTLSWHLNWQYISQLSVVYRSTGGGILFFVNLHYFDVFSQVEFS